MFSIDLEVLNLLVGFFIPILVAILTKEVTNPAVKAWSLAFASAVTGIAVAAQAAGGLVAADAVISSLTTMVVAVASYYGLWKPTGIAPKVQHATDKKHIGLG